MTEIRIIEKITPNILKRLARIRDDKRLAEWAKRLNIHAPRLTELLTGKRKVSYGYVILFIRGGMMSVEELFEGVDINGLGEVGKNVVARLQIEDAIINKISLLKSKNVSKDKILKALSILDE